MIAATNAGKDKEFKRTSGKGGSDFSVRDHRWYREGC